MMLAGILRDNGFDLAFQLLDAGAVPMAGETEPYHRLLQVFPASRLYAFELDPAVCAELNCNALPGARFFPCALGRAEETRTLYRTRDPMSTSLYEPDPRYAEMFGRLDDMKLVATEPIETTPLDVFARRHALPPLDFMKLDIQGAELDVLQGGAQAMHDALLIVCETEFAPIYHGQPLFGDVDAWLRARGMMLHKFLGMAGRVAKPLAVHGRVDYPAQFLWSDAVFARDLFALDALPAERQLKLAVLFDLYESKDLALKILRGYDAVHDDDLADIYWDAMRAEGKWGMAEGAGSK